MMAYHLPEARVTLGHLLPGVALAPHLATIPVAGLTADSRTVKPGYVFVAMAGWQHHGKLFIPQAEARGAVAVLVDKRDDCDNPATSLPLIAVDHLRQALSGIAGRFYAEPSVGIPLIGITGTNGKTSCVQLLAQALAHLDKPCGVMGTLGYGLMAKQQGAVTAELTTTGLTTPDGIATQGICAELSGRGAHCIAMEVSSHAMAQHRVAGLDINTAVFTNLTHDHLDYHGSMAAYGAAKASLFALPSVSVAVVNRDDDFAPTILAATRDTCRRITFGLGPNTTAVHSADGPGEDFTLVNIQPGVGGMTAELVTPQGCYKLSTRLLGQFNLSNLLAVIACLYAQGIAIADILRVLPLLVPASGRMEVIANRLGLQVVVDYAHTPDALQQALAALKPWTQGNLWCVFGCAGDRDREKRPLMARVAEEMADHIIVTSDNPRGEPPEQILADIQRGFQQPADPSTGMVRALISDRDSAIEYALNAAHPGDTVVIAGKGHEDYQQIGDQRLPVSDEQQARLYLRRRERGEFRND